MTDDASILFTDDLDKEVIAWRGEPSMLPSLGKGQVQLWRVALDEHSDDAVDVLADTLSAEEKHRASRFRFETDRRRFVVGRGALRAILGKYLATSPVELAFEYGHWGKPSLAGNPAIQFNVSHCQGWYMLAVCGGSPVGIDIEKLVLPQDYLAIAADCFDAEQVRMLKAADPEFGSRDFFRLWTCLEAACKASGVPLSDGAPEGLPMNMRHYIPAEGFVAALAGHPGL